jgi:hypothetical protein
MQTRFALKDGNEEEKDAKGAKYTEDSVYNAHIDPFNGEAEEKQPDRYLDDTCCHHIDQPVYVKELDLISTRTSD